jgi:hypothetical protein
MFHDLFLQYILQCLTILLCLSIYITEFFQVTQNYCNISTDRKASYMGINDLQITQSMHCFKKDGKVQHGNNCKEKMCSLVHIFICIQTL